MSLYSACDELSGDGINTSVLYHLTSDLVGAGYSEFRGVIIRQLSLLVAGLGFWFWSVRRKPARPLPALQERGAVFLMVGWSLFWAGNPTLWAAVRLAPSINQARSASSAVSVDWLKVRKRLGLKMPGETSRETARPRNLVWIYAESVERTYFDEKRFPGLMPELRRLSSEALDFTRVHSLEGTTWTIGGIAASQCGVPLIGALDGLDRNDHAGMVHFLPGAHCLSDHLADRGYDFHFLGGARASFAGKGRFFEQHRYAEVGDLHTLSSWIGEPQSSWGLYDDRILEITRERFDALQASRKPFALVTLTLDTHHPRGHETPACRGLQYRDGSNPMLNAIHCTDRLISQHVREIQARDPNGETLIVISSDHLAMPNEAYPLLTSGGRTNLFLVLNSGLPARRIEREGSTLDAGSTILDLLGYRPSNVGLGTSLLQQEPTFVERNSGVERANPKLLSMARDFRSLWVQPHFPEREIFVDPIRKKVVFSGTEFGMPVLMVGTPGKPVQTMFNDYYKNGDLSRQMPKLSAGQSALRIDYCERMSELARDSGARICLEEQRFGASPRLVPVRGLSPIALGAAAMGGETTVE